MKLVYEGEVQAQGGIGSAVAGARCDEIIFSAHDIRVISVMLRSGSETQVRALAASLEHLLCRFVPGAK
jgi:hypothetical protein